MNQKVHLFNQTIKNILCNFIPHETVTCDDRDPPWITSKIKGLIQKKNFAKKCYFQNNEDIQLFRRFQNIQKLLTATIEKSKEQYYTRISTKLMDPTTSPKAYWSILKTVLNTKKYLVSHQFIIITILLPVLKRRLKSSTTFLLSSAH